VLPVLYEDHLLEKDWVTSHSFCIFAAIIFPLPVPLPHPFHPSCLNPPLKFLMVTCITIFSFYPRKILSLPSPSKKPQRRPEKRKSPKSWSLVFPFSSPFLLMAVQSISSTLFPRLLFSRISIVEWKLIFDPQPIKIAFSLFRSTV